jgi:dihydrofolate reductase
MSRIVVIEYVSLDGVVQAPGHADEDRDGGFEHGGWTAPLMHEHASYLSDQFNAAGGFLLGRRTYEIWASHWPTVKDERDTIAAALNSRPKYVASTKLQRPEWRGTRVIRDVPRETAELRQLPGGPILVMGSSVLVHTLTTHRLVGRPRLAAGHQARRAGRSSGTAKQVPDS